jgi:hypothetical protein
MDFIDFMDFMNFMNFMNFRLSLLCAVLPLCRCALEPLHPYSIVPLHLLLIPSLASRCHGTGFRFAEQVLPEGDHN